MWTAVIIVGIAAAAHQGWSAKVVSNKTGAMATNTLATSCILTLENSFMSFLIMVYRF